MARLVGVLGGTFDPPHYGHLRLAGEARRMLLLDKVLWVVTAVPPHKPLAPVASIDTRLQLVRAALKDEQGFELSLADVERPAPHYAAGTMEWLRQRDPAAQFAYIMGSDSLIDLPTWHDPAGFLALCWRLAVLQRPGPKPDLATLEEALPGLGEKVVWVEATLVDVSASEIRRRVKQDLPYKHLMPPGVAKIIEDLGLYR
ncbi:MAG: nicotinate (nicotinamide) nucleotide adenylyltransferase [Anaerolineales bacterium]|nr:nicotinate (nicotinamide) nucleotide adenylyltransferase [Anaerolineales bacterium]